MTDHETPPSTAEHWDATYALGAATRSWFQTMPTPSLRMLDAAGVTPTDSVIDVGGGASTLVDALLERGHSDVTVLDVSAAGLDVAQHRLADRATRVRWIVADLRDWQPARSYRVWHDRAVLHFLTDEPSRQAYLTVLAGATVPGSLAIFATFAPDGPQRCSGLPVCRYGPTALAGLLSDQWHPLHHDDEQHITPGGAPQHFTWAAFRRT